MTSPRKVRRGKLTGRMIDELTESRKVRLGAFAVIIGVLTGVGFGICRYVEPVRPFLVHITVALMLLGMSGCLITRMIRSKDQTEDDVLHFYEKPGCWGKCLVIAAVLTFISVRIADPPQPEAVHAQVDLPTSTPGVEFPPIAVRGVTLNGTRSTVVIGKEVLLVGESYEGVRIIKIFEDGILVEKDGEQRTYYRDTTRPVPATDGDVIFHHNQH